MSRPADSSPLEHMTMKNEPTEVLPGFLRTDLDFLARCLEGKLGEGRVTEAAPQAAAFIRAALAIRLQQLPVVSGPLPRLLAGAQERGMLLSEREAQQIEQERMHEARNRGDADPAP
jgi:hypothetical protein